MVRNRLITVLTINDGVLFRTRDFIPDYRYTLNFVDSWSIDEIVILDITRGENRSKKKFYKVVEDIATSCFVPLAVGGGVKSIDDFSALLNLGADKIIINTEAYDNPDLISIAAKKFGSQCVVVSIDAKLGPDGSYETYTNLGSKKRSLEPKVWAKKVEDYGAGEIMITSIHKDGTLEGYDNKLNSVISDTVDIPVLVSGGAGRWQDFVDGVILGGGSAVCTTNIYHFTESSISSAKKYMKNKKINVRI